ncbi:MAG: hypothetical protein DRH43_08150 [Deltaproteobacteria bacterium]|nr:MAG: hypothetical protein DRH43_08150 [Deltaproteobacteria bacterium]
MLEFEAVYTGLPVCDNIFKTLKRYQKFKLIRFVDLYPIIPVSSAALVIKNVCCSAPSQGALLHRAVFRRLPMCRAAEHG